MKMMILAGRKPGMSRAEFRRYVTEVHGPLVKSVPEVARSIHHYHYNFPILGAADTAFNHPSASQLDIVTQGWFDSREAQLAGMAEPKYLAIVRPDEGRFANEVEAVMHYTVEVAIVAGATTAIKVFYFRRRRADLSRQQFQAAWRTRFADALASSSGFAAAASSYVQNHALSEAEHPDGTDPKFFDVIDELRLRGASPAALREDAAALAKIQSLEAELCEPSRTLSLVTETVMSIP
jgi:EthD domain